VEAQGQVAVVQVEENLRVEPNGTILGRLLPGTRLAVQEREGGWSRVTLEGFVWTRSMRVHEEDGFDLVISEEGGENFRDEPSGRIAARLVEGTRLEELERVPGWARVRRTAWGWSAALYFRGQHPAAQERGREAGEGAPERTRWLRGPAAMAPILSAPDGDTIGQVRGGSDLRVVTREGNWARVQLEGWVWVPALGEEDEPADGSIVTDIAAQDLAADPDRHRGRRVELTLQYISLERAERVRTDFYEGEPFLLTRSVGDERIFVYVAVPPERMGEVEDLTPLERIRLVGRVRTGAAALTGNPVLDLMEVERLRP
jgi:hypothetical protein